MKYNRNADTKTASPATGSRSRIGHVVRWHAEPVTMLDSREDLNSGAATGITAEQETARPV